MKRSNLGNLILATSLGLAGCNAAPSSVAVADIAAPGIRPSVDLLAPFAGERDAASHEPAQEGSPAYMTQGFNFGDGSTDGSGSFLQDIPRNARTEVGVIPAGIKDVDVRLDSDVDVDVELWVNGQPLVSWPQGKLSGPGPQTLAYNGVTVHWSGYNGDQTPNGRGREYLRISGTTRNAFTMKAFGFQAGKAPVTYTWRGTGAIKECGSGAFDQPIPFRARTYVGTIPKGISDLYVRLASPVDTDVELWDGATPVVGWPSGKLNGPGRASLSYRGVSVEWSGYNGDQQAGGRGKEYIRISGTTQNDFTMKAFGFEAGQAPVTYTWGASPCGSSGSGNTGGSGSSPTVAEAAIANLAQKLQSQTGSAITGIQKTASGDGYEQRFRDGSGVESAILARTGSSEAQWVHHGIYLKFKEVGATGKLGYPTSSETKGYASEITGKASAYQLFDGGTKPSIQWVSGRGAFLLTGAMRDYWWENRKALGLPKTDIDSVGSQVFEGGIVSRFGNGYRIGPDIADKAYKGVSSGGNTNLFDKFGADNMQCTRFAWGRAYEKLGLKLAKGGDARTWLEDVKSANDGAIALKSDKAIAANSIAVWRAWNGDAGQWGHAAFVEAVNGGTVYYTEANVSPAKKYSGIRTKSVSDFEAQFGTVDGYIHLAN